MPPQPLTPETNGFNVFALKACQCLRALGSVMVMIVLLLILLTYYTTVFLVYGKMMFLGGNKAIAAAVIVIIYNVLVSNGVKKQRASRVLSPTWPAHEGLWTLCFHH